MKGSKLKWAFPQRPVSNAFLAGPMYALGLVLATQAAFIAPAQANTVWVAPSQRDNDTTTIDNPGSTPDNWAGVRARASGDSPASVFFNFAFPEDMILPPSIDPTAKLIAVVKANNLNRCNLGLGASFSDHLGSNAQYTSSIPSAAVAQSAGTGTVVELDVSALFDTVAISAAYNDPNRQTASVRANFIRSGGTCDLMVAGLRFDYEGTAGGGGGGATGPTGATGAAGASDYLRVTGTPSASNATTPKTAVADCTGGRKVLGGGYDIVVTDGTDSGTTLDNIAEINVVINRASDDDTWTVTAAVDNTGDMDDNWTLTAYAVCATMNP